MTNLYLYLAALTGLVAVLLLIANRTLAMVRAGRPLLAVGALEWHARAPRVPPQSKPTPPRLLDPAKPGRLAAFIARLRPNARVPIEPIPDAPPRERSRRLASLSEFDAAELAIRFPATEQSAAQFAAGTEARLEAELDRLCAGAIDLPTFADYVAQQQAELDRHLTAAGDAGTLAALEAAAAIIAFSREWVSQQQ